MLKFSLKKKIGLFDFFEPVASFKKKKIASKISIILVCYSMNYGFIDWLTVCWLCYFVFSKLTHFKG